MPHLRSTRLGQDNHQLEHRTLPRGPFDDLSLVVHDANGRVAIEVQCLLYRLLVCPRDVYRTTMPAQLPARVRDGLRCLYLDRDAPALMSAPCPRLYSALYWAANRFAVVLWDLLSDTCILLIDHFGEHEGYGVP